jgi:hypothetical protein
MVLLAAVKDDLTRLEKLLSFTGGPPVPSMLEESPLKSDAPSTTTTWLVIFLIVIFMGLLAGQFFFTGQRRLKPGGEPGEPSGSAGPGASKSSEMPTGTGPSGRGDLPSVGTPTHPHGARIGQYPHGHQHGWSNEMDSAAETLRRREWYFLRRPDGGADTRRGAGS